MSKCVENNCACPPVEIIEIPGAEGSSGANGTNGINAFTISAADFTIPAIGSNETALVGNSSFLAINENVFFGDGTNFGNFQVVSFPSNAAVELKFLGYTGDSAAGNIITSGATLTPSGIKGVDGTTPTAPTNTNAFGSGTAYQLTTTPALLNLGTTIPQITIPADGNYILAAWVRYDYNAATFAANRTVTTKIRRTNNTATDIAGTTRSYLTEIITTKTFTAGGYVVALIPYVGTTGDILEVWGSVDTLPSAGSLDAVEASIISFGVF